MCYITDHCSHPLNLFSKKFILNLAVVTVSIEHVLYYSVSLSLSYTHTHTHTHSNPFRHDATLFNFLLKPSTILSTNNSSFESQGLSNVEVPINLLVVSERFSQFRWVN